MIRTDGTDLVVSDPNSSMRRRRRFHAEPAAEADDGLLQLTHIPTDALREQDTAHNQNPKPHGFPIRPPPDLLKAPQVQYRVADQLAWPVEGDESSSVGAVDVGPQQPELVQQGARVRFVADPRSVDRRVLTEQQRVGRTGPVPVHIDLLKPQTLMIGDQAQADHLHQGPAGLHPELRRDQEKKIQSKQTVFGPDDFI